MKKAIYILVTAFSFFVFPPLAIFLIFRMPELKGKKAAKLIVSVPLALYTLVWAVVMFSPSDTDSVYDEENIAQVETQNSTVTETVLPNEDTNTYKKLSDIDTAQADKQFDLIYNAVEENEVAATDTYVGNRYIICGVINGMKEVDKTFGKDVINLTMEQKVGNTVVFYYAEFYSEKWREEIKNLSVGDTIYFEGTCEGGYWRDCDLIL